MPTTSVLDTLTPILMTGGLLLLGLVLMAGGASIAFGAVIKGARGERAVRRVLTRHFEAVHDLLVPDNREARSWTQIDHVVRLPACLVCIETKNYDGLIFGSARQAQWTQVLGRNKHRFQNPLRQNHKHVKAVEAAAGGTPTQSLVVFTGRARFPKGLPEGVCKLEELIERLV